MSKEEQRIIEGLDDAREKLLEAIQTAGKFLVEGHDNSGQIEKRLCGIVLGDIEPKVVAATYLLASKGADKGTKAAVMFRLGICHTSYAQRAREEAKKLAV